MKTKVWNYAPDRDDCVVQTEESVVFENEHVGWFVANPDPNGRRRQSNMGVWNGSEMLSFWPISAAGML